MVQTPFERAKTAYLPTLVSQVGYKLVPQGRSYGVNYCPKCNGEYHGNGGNKVSIFVGSDGNWKWRCFACGNPASSVIDWVAYQHGAPAKKAVEIILQDCVASTPRPTAVNINAVNINADASDKIDEIAKAMESVLLKITSSTGYSVAKEYLSNRGISASVIDEAYRRKLLFSISKDPYEARNFLMENVGRELLLASGLLKQGASTQQDWPAIAFRPIIFPIGKNGAEFRKVSGDKPGDPKAIRYGRLAVPWWWVGQEKEKTMFVEGGIDALSVICLGWTGNVVFVPGVYSWRDEWLDKISVKQENNTFFIGFDNDAPGIAARDKVTVAASLRGLKWEIATPPQGFKDWNEVLKHDPKAKVWGVAS